MHKALALVIVVGFSLITTADVLHRVPPKILILKTLSRLLIAAVAIANLWMLS